jgi:pyruvate,water dikinase
MRELPMDEWNATLTGDYLWTNMIVGEVFPTAVTPSTWSVWQDFFNLLTMGDMPFIERIAGRPYLNYSLTYSFMLKIMRKHERVMGSTEDAIGVPPEGVEIPLIPVSWRTVLLGVVLREARNEVKKARLRKAAPEFLAMVRERCQEFGRRIERAQEEELVALWTEEIRPLWRQIHSLQDKMNEELKGLTGKLKAELVKSLGEEDAGAYLTTMSSAGELDSLGPLVGLSKLRDGELSRAEYLLQYGHRGPHENELAEPRIYEDPDALDEQLADFDQSPVDVAALLAKRDAEAAAIWGEIKRALSPKQAQAIERMIDGTREATTLREATRSELTRLVGVIRALLLRAGELARVGDGVFFLSINEVVDLLSGNRLSVAQIPTRRDAYEKCRALPPLPAWIRGRFDPYQRAADPDRRGDLFDAQMPAFGQMLASSRTLPGDNLVRGQPGSAGRVEGMVQRIDSPDEGDRLQSGEILVATTTNVGWTPLFPRAAAVVTDVGGSLSHAAIVARELGIPAVVGCGDATVRLKTGDRVLVDGRRGVVEILDAC